MAAVVHLRGFLEVIDGVVVNLTFSNSVDEWSYRQYEVADETEDETINLTGIAAVDIFYIESDQAVTIKINGSSDSITIDANAPYLTMGTNITAATISNESGSTADVKIFIAGT
jgi:hypothetical protein